ncbi:MAG: ubiquitin [Trebouxia sp. A1-2]|nr:MAG: ubiquitin [Trebouxia sp. A1-2]
MDSAALSPVQIERHFGGFDVIKAQPVDEKANWTMSLQQSQSNETTVMTIHPWWTVHQLKKLIQVLNGHSLRDDLRISNSGLFDGCAVKLATRLSAKNKQVGLSESLINISVKTMKGSKSELWVNPGWTVLQLQQSIEQVMGVPLHNQRLIFAGHQLESAFTLHDYGLKKGYMLYLSVRVTDR